MKCARTFAGFLVWLAGPETTRISGSRDQWLNTVQVGGAGYNILVDSQQVELFFTTAAAEYIDYHMPNN